MQDVLAVTIVCVVGAIVITCMVSATCLIWRFFPTNRVTSEDGSHSAVVSSASSRSSDLIKKSLSFRSLVKKSRDSIKKSRESTHQSALVQKITEYEMDDTPRSACNELKASLEGITAKAVSLRSLNFTQMNVKDMFQFENLGELCGSSKGGIVVIHSENLKDVSTKNFTDSTGNTPAQIKRYLEHIGQKEDSIKLCVAPASHLTLPDEKKYIANIPDEATHYCYCYPLATTSVWPDGVEKGDPLLDLFHFGGFIYFDKAQQQPKIVAINSFFAEGTPDCKIFIGQCLPMSHASIQAFETSQRWKPVTIFINKDPATTVAHAWVTPNEKVGDKQFTRNGGFAYLYSNKRTGESEGFFFPVIGNESEHTHYKLTDARETVYFEALQPNDTLGADGGNGSKFSSVSYSMVTSLDLGLSANASIHFLLGISKSALRKIQDQGIESITAEWGALASSKEEKEAQRLRGVLEYALGTAKVEEVVGNHGQRVMRDEGHDGFTLDRFLEEPQCKTAELVLAEVLALRLYTSTAFREVNSPLRDRADPKQKDTNQWEKHPVPLPATTYFISSAVTKLQALHIEGFKSFELWRGLANMNDVSEEYIQSGGHELA
jgi:hypothetical protein